jgi:hypothetical protein
MTEPSAAAEPSNAPAPLSRWLLILATALLVAWCVPRVKPVGWFGPLFGLLTAGVAIGLEKWLGQPSGRGRSVLVAASAILGSAAVFGFTIREAERASNRDPNQAAAEALMRSMEQGLDPTTATSTSTPSWLTPVVRYANRRYGTAVDPSWSGLVMEVVAAGIVAGIVNGAARIGKPRTPRAAA